MLGNGKKEGLEFELIKLQVLISLLFMGAR
jgi:hypothetical protein